MAKISSVTPIGPGVIDVKQKRLDLHKSKQRQQHAEFSTTVGEVMQELEAVEVVGIDEKKLEAIKSAITEGRYSIDVDHLAENLLNEFFRD